MTCVFNDVNGNKKLDTSDKLACVEGDENKFGTDVRGKDAKVELLVTIDGAEERVGDATWTPPSK